MLANIEINWMHWAGFFVCIFFFMALDLGVFHKKAGVVRFKEAIIWTTVWVAVAAIFGLLVWHWRGSEEGLEFYAGYLIELSLSMDNVFVIALIFTYFRIPREYQHEVLFWGILGALVMRGVMIFAGASLVERFEWLLVIFGIFLIYSGLKIIFSKDEDEVDPGKNPLLKLARKFYPVTEELRGDHFFARLADGRLALTPLMMVLLVIETTDLIFALDSIPAVFGITQKKFVIFTSNIFAILGLRSMYFALAGAVECFRYLKVGLSVVLTFVGVKMIIAIFLHIKISTPISLAIVVAILLTSIVVSLLIPQKDKDKK